MVREKIHLIKDPDQKKRIYNFLKKKIIYKKFIHNEIHRLTKRPAKVNIKYPNKINPSNRFPKNDIINVNKKNKNYIVSSRSILHKLLTTKKLDDGSNFMDILNDTINRTNKIVFHTYNFIKLYLIYIVDNNLDFPCIDINFIRVVMNTITVKIENRGYKPITCTDLEIFYKDHYKPLILKEDIINRDKLKYILNYEEKDIITNISNNISCHYIKHLDNFLWKKFDITGKIEKINNNKKISKQDKRNKIVEIKTEHKNFVNDILNVSNKNIYVSNVDHLIIDKYRKLFIPNKIHFTKGKLVPNENIVRYDIKCNPLDYLKNMIILSKEYEKFNNAIILVHDKNITKYPNILKMFNAIPLRNNIIPKFITLDTASIISLFIKKGSAELLKNVKELGYEIFNRFFNLKSKSFKRKDIIITNEIKNKSIVAIDIGKTDIISCMKRNTTKMILVTSKKKKSKLALKNHLKNIHFTYTIGQRNKDTCKQKYMKIRKILGEKILYKDITVNKLETELSKLNSKTSNFELMKNFIMEKNKLNRLLYDHYNIPIFRKLKWNTYNNTRRSESNMVDNFRKIFGEPNETIIVLGDHSDTGLKGTD